MSTTAFSNLAWRAIGAYVAHVDALATPAEARAFMLPYAVVLTAYALPQWQYGASPDPLAAVNGFYANVPPPMRPEIVRELRSRALAVPSSPAYYDANPDAGMWYMRARRIVALADDPLPVVSSPGSLALAQVLMIFRQSYLVSAARTFWAPPPQPMYQPTPITVFPDNPDDPMPPPIEFDPVPIDRTAEAGLVPLALVWDSFMQRVQEMVDKASAMYGL